MMSFNVIYIVVQCVIRLVIIIFKCVASEDRCGADVSFTLFLTYIITACIDFVVSMVR